MPCRNRSEDCLNRLAGSARWTPHLTAQDPDTPAGTPAALALRRFGHSTGTVKPNASFPFTAPAVCLPRPRSEIAGPQGVQVTFTRMAAKASNSARMCTAILINTLTT